jgi:hypothetical protein
MSDPDLVKRAWAASAADAVVPDLDTARANADWLYRKVRRRNRIEYGASVLGVLICLVVATLTPVPVLRAGIAMIVPAVMFTTWHLHRHGSAAAPPEQAAAMPILVHQRAQLARQRDLTASIVRWYLLPYVPGVLTLVLGPPLAHGLEGLLRAPLRAWLSLALGLATVAAYFGFTWVRNMRSTRRREQLIAEIDALIGPQA